MSSKTKILVLKSRELIYTGIFILFGALLVLLLVYMFTPKKDKKPIESTSENASESTITEELSTEIEPTYSPGVYSTSLNLGGYDSVLTVTVTSEGVSHVDIQNTDETVTAMYPLLAPSVEDINNQLENHCSINNINYSDEKQYTTVLLLEAIKQALASTPD